MRLISFKIIRYTACFFAFVYLCRIYIEIVNEITEIDEQKNKHKSHVQKKYIRLSLHQLKNRLKHAKVGNLEDEGKVSVPYDKDVFNYDEIEYNDDDRYVSEDEEGRIVNSILKNLALQKENFTESSNLNSFFKSREQVYSERRNRIKEVCNSLNGEGNFGSFKSLPLSRFRWLTKKGLIMCFNAKVGTTTWTEYLLEGGWPGIMKNVSHWHAAAHRYLRSPFSKTSKSTEYLFHKMSKIILVRHPFARIVSAYKDKIMRKKMPKLNRFVIKKYRLDDQSKIKSPKYPTFEEFVSFLVDKTPTNDSVWIKKAHRTDRHWFHYYANCAPCDINYEVVAKTESVEDDTRYIFEKFRFEAKTSDWYNHRGSSSSEADAIAFFQKLPRHLSQSLYERYRIDFLMFGYSHQPYLESTR